MPASPRQTGGSYAQRFMDFVSSTGSPYHSVLAARTMLLATGFRQLCERDSSWNGTIKPGGKYFITRNDSEIFAFIVGGKFRSSDAAPALAGPSVGNFVMIGSHTDSPCLRLRPKWDNKGDGYLRLGVVPYGGGLWHTWYDRPLGLAGKVITKDQTSHLVRITDPVCLIPNLAIHLQSADERKAFEVGLDDNLIPIMCQDSSSLTKQSADNSKAQPSSPHPLVQMVKKAAGLTEQDEISDMDLCLMDVTPATKVGSSQEFISTARVDNVLSLFASMSALSSLTSQVVSDSNSILIAAAFDHEEVGSESACGAATHSTVHWMQRIAEALGASLESMCSGSLLVSMDCAHASHPNYASKSQPEHKIYLNKGVVLKHNANQRYATNIATSSIIRRIAAEANVPLQDFVVKNASPCGSTIGPILSTKLGVAAVDIGAPQWAMHSIRETCGVQDVEYLERLSAAIFSSLNEKDIALLYS